MAMGSTLRGNGIRFVIKTLLLGGDLAQMAMVSTPDAVVVDIKQ